MRRILGMIFGVCNYSLCILIDWFNGRAFLAHATIPQHLVSVPHTHTLNELGSLSRDTLKWSSEKASMCKKKTHRCSEKCCCPNYEQTESNRIYPIRAHKTQQINNNIWSSIFTCVMLFHITAGYVSMWIECSTPICLHIVLLLIHLSEKSQSNAKPSTWLLNCCIFLILQGMECVAATLSRLVIIFVKIVRN